jgi:hypothetical protein
LFRADAGKKEKYSIITPKFLYWASEKRIVLERKRKFEEKSAVFEPTVTYKVELPKDKI